MIWRWLVLKFAGWRINLCATKIETRSADTKILEEQRQSNSTTDRLVSTKLQYIVCMSGQRIHVGSTNDRGFIMCSNRTRYGKPLSSAMRQAARQRRLSENP